MVGKTPIEQLLAALFKLGETPFSPVKKAPSYRIGEFEVTAAETSIVTCCPYKQEVNAVAAGWSKVSEDEKSLAVQFRSLPKRVPAQL